MDPEQQQQDQAGDAARPVSTSTSHQLQMQQLQAQQQQQLPQTVGSAQRPPQNLQESIQARHSSARLSAFGPPLTTSTQTSQASPRSPRSFEYSPNSRPSSLLFPLVFSPVSPGSNYQASPQLQSTASWSGNPSPVASPTRDFSSEPYSPHPRNDNPTSHSQVGNASPQTQSESHPPQPQDENPSQQAPGGEASRSAATRFGECRVTLAIDISGSTAGRILASEREFVVRIVSQLVQPTVSQNVHVLPWNHAAPRPCQVQNLHTLQSYGGTDPVVLLKSQPHLAALKLSNIWFLLTDGEILDNDVNSLAATLAEKGMHGVPCVIVIFDTRSCIPSDCNISVGISPFAAVPNSALLYQNVISRTCYVLATKGCFNSFLPEGAEQPVLDHRTRWADLPTIEPGAAFRSLVIPAARELAPEELALSDDLTINFEDLFQTDLDNGQVNQLLGNQNHLQSLLLSAQTHGRTASALSWLQRQNIDTNSNRSSVANDVGGVAAQSIRQITQAIQNQQFDGPEFERAARELREAHRRNSQHRNSRVQVINQAIDSLNYATRQNWQSASLSAHRQSTTSQISLADTTIAGANASDSCIGECSICFETDAVLAILFKRPVDFDADAVGKNLTLTFPLSNGGSPEYDIISAWLVCEDCSGYLVEQGETPFRERAMSALPLVSWSKTSPVWRDALTKALDYFNPAFQSLVPVLFLAILDHHIRTKEWAKDDGSTENQQRKRALLWLRSTILREVKMSGDGTKGTLGAWIRQIVCNPTKGELGLIWKYPMDGFVFMLEIAKEQGAKQELITKIVWRKILHHITARYTAELGQDTDKQRMVARVDLVVGKMTSPGWVNELVRSRARLVGKSDLEVLRRLKDEMQWVEDVAGPAMRRWLAFLKELGTGKSTAESIWEIKGRWGAEAEMVMERPEDVISVEGGDMV